MTEVRFVDIGAQFQEERSELLARIEAVLASGMLVGGVEVDRLEEELAAYCGATHAVTLNSGTDALILGMAAAGLGPGDEVITPPNSFLASTSSIVKIGAKPVFADVRDDELIDPDAVEAAITPNTAAIMAVHLRGGVCDMPRLRDVASRHGLLLIEDAAQAIGSAFEDVRTGALGDLGCFSTHPLKLLNAAGDGGFVTTNSDEVAGKLRRMRNHGLVDRNTSTEWGLVSRMDALQAAVLRLRLTRLGDVIERRRRNARDYLGRLNGNEIVLPRERAGEFHTYTTFTIQTPRRDALQAALRAKGIESAVHYPRPIHLQPAAASLGAKAGDYPVTERLADTILSLPVHQFLTAAQRDAVVAEIQSFFLS